MSDEQIRRLEREDFRRWRIELVRLGRAPEAGFALGDVVSFIEEPETNLVDASHNRTNWPRPCLVKIKGFSRAFVMPHAENDSKDGEFCDRCDMHHEGPCLDQNLHDRRVAKKGEEPLSGWERPKVILEILDREKDRCEGAWHFSTASPGPRSAIRLVEVGPCSEKRPAGDHEPECLDKSQDATWRCICTNARVEKTSLDGNYVAMLADIVRDEIRSKSPRVVFVDRAMRPFSFDYRPFEAVLLRIPAERFEINANDFVPQTKEDSVKARAREKTRENVRRRPPRRLK